MKWKKKKKKNIYTQIKISSIIFHLQTEHSFTSDIPFKISASKEARRGRGRCKKCPKATRKHLPRSYPSPWSLFQGVSSSIFFLLFFFFFFFFRLLQRLRPRALNASNDDTPWSTRFYALRKPRNSSPEDKLQWFLWNIKGSSLNGRRRNDRYNNNRACCDRRKMHFDFRNLKFIPSRVLVNENWERRLNICWWWYILKF